jgi:GntP family gluconate:H+ symporter
MNPVTVLLVGVVIVIGGVLVLRLHAFLALVLAAITVGVLTPSEWIEDYAVRNKALAEHSVSADGREITLTVKSSKELSIGERLVVLRFGDRQGALAEAIVRAEAVVARYELLDGNAAESKRHVAVVLVPQGTDSTDILVTKKDAVAAQKLAKQTVGQRVATAFGTTCGKIGILIAMAAIIGKCLLESGAADRMVRSTLRLFGQRGAPAAFLTSGFALGIPVFFDTVFYLMIPLGKAMRTRTGGNYLFYVLTIVAGATMAHSLVPPTPGPLFVAEELGVDVGTMILGGMAVGLVTIVVGYVYAKTVNRFCELPLRESADFTLEDLEKLAQRDESELPPLWISILPILLPVVLIGGLTVLRSLPTDLPDPLMRVAETLGNKNIALVLSAAVAMAMLVRQSRPNRRELAASMQAALASGGVIILITAAGGAFGRTIQQTGVANLISDLPTGSPALILAAAFLITTAVRTAQGSATVAMITAVGILSGLATSGQLPFHPVYLALAIGCGSKPIAWMNDSGFWVICKMSGMTEGEGLRYITPMTATMGLVGLGVTILGATWWPLV